MQETEYIVDRLAKLASPEDGQVHTKPQFNCGVLEVVRELNVDAFGELGYIGSWVIDFNVISEEREGRD